MLWIFLAAFAHIFCWDSNPLTDTEIISFQQPFGEESSASDGQGRWPEPRHCQIQHLQPQPEQAAAAEAPGNSCKHTAGLSGSKVPTPPTQRASGSSRHISVPACMSRLFRSAITHIHKQMHPQSQSSQENSRFMSVGCGQNQITAVISAGEKKLWKYPDLNI